MKKSKTLIERAIISVPGFETLYHKLERSVELAGKSQSMARANQKTVEQTYMKKRESRRNRTPMAKTEENGLARVKNSQERLQNVQCALMPWQKH